MEVHRRNYYNFMAPEIINYQGYDQSLDWYLVGAILYYMLLGKAPFYSEVNDTMRLDILEGPLPIPSSVSPEAMNLVEKLMERDTAKRLGSAPEESASTIMAHAFFKDVDW